MRVLYLCYNGLLEPLTQSQVLAYLEGLAARHTVTLVTFEKPEHDPHGRERTALAARCRAAGIDWRPQRYHRRPRLLASAWDCLVLLSVCLRAALGGRPDLIHCRSYLPTFVGLVAGGILRRPFLFDMRAFWPEELVSAGRLRAGSALFRLLKWAERRCLLNAAAVVTLSEASEAYLASLSGLGRDRIRYAVIPTCADLSRFTPRADGARSDGGPIFATTGTVWGGWFRLDWLFRLFAALAARRPEARFEILTRSPEDAVRAAAEPFPAVAARLSIRALPPAEMPAALRRVSACAMFFLGDISKLASCPTRMGEMLAAGLPVAGNTGIGDVAAIIRRFGVGVVVETGSPAEMEGAADQLLALIDAPDTPRRCRAAAEAWFSLEAGIARYDRLYEAIRTGAFPAGLNRVAADALPAAP